MINIIRERKREKETFEEFRIGFKKVVKGRADINDYAVYWHTLRTQTSFGNIAIESGNAEQLKRSVLPTAIKFHSNVATCERQELTGRVIS